MKLKRTWHQFLIVCSLLLLQPAASVLAYDDAAALKGVKEGKGVFLVDLTDPRKTALYLEIIQGTHAGLVRQGVRPDFVVVYIGPTVRFLNNSPGDELELEYEDELVRIRAAVSALGELGVPQEVCAIATRVFDVDNDSLLPELRLVGDGFISLIGYQSQGYHLVPIY